MIDDASGVAKPWPRKPSHTVHVSSKRRLQGHKATLITIDGAVTVSATIASYGKISTCTLIFVCDLCRACPAFQTRPAPPLLALVFTSHLSQHHYWLAADLISPLPTFHHGERPPLRRATACLTLPHHDLLRTCWTLSRARLSLLHQLPESRISKGLATAEIQILYLRQTCFDTLLLRLFKRLKTIHIYIMREGPARNMRHFAPVVSDCPCCCCWKVRTGSGLVLSLELALVNLSPLVSAPRTVLSPLVASMEDSYGSSFGGLWIYANLCCHHHRPRRCSRNAKD
jgi:hypothetical protein